MAVTYCIDSEDRIVSWSPEYADFAIANDGKELADPELKGRSLWDFIADSDTLAVYRSLVDNAREGRPSKFDFRCDGPTTRRTLRMSVVEHQPGSVCFSIETIAAEPRTEQRLFDRRQARSEESVLFCSWCSRLRVALETWHEVEQAVETLNLFNGEAMPRLDYVMCDSCYADRSPRRTA